MPIRCHMWDIRKMKLMISSNPFPKYANYPGVNDPIYPSCMYLTIVLSIFSADNIRAKCKWIEFHMASVCLPYDCWNPWITQCLYIYILKNAVCWFNILNKYYRIRELIYFAQNALLVYYTMKKYTQTRIINNKFFSIHTKHSTGTFSLDCRRRRCRLSTINQTYNSHWHSIDL